MILGKNLHKTENKWPNVNKSKNENSIQIRAYMKIAHPPSSLYILIDQITFGALSNIVKLGKLIPPNVLGNNSIILTTIRGCLNI